MQDHVTPRSTKEHQRRRSGRLQRKCANVDDVSDVKCYAKKDEQKKHHREPFNIMVNPHLASGILLMVGTLIRHELFKRLPVLAQGETCRWV